MDDSKPCKNCDDLARKNIQLEIKVKKLESKLSYYENPNSPPSANWVEQLCIAIALLVSVKNFSAICVLLVIILAEFPKLFVGGL